MEERRICKNRRELEWIKFAEDYARVQYRWNRIYDPSSHFILNLLNQLTTHGGLTDAQWKKALSDFKFDRWICAVKEQREKPSFPLYRMYSQVLLQEDFPIPAPACSASACSASACSISPVSNITETSSDAWGSHPESHGESDPWGDDSDDRSDQEFEVTGEDSPFFNMIRRNIGGI